MYWDFLKWCDSFLRMVGATKMGGIGLNAGTGLFYLMIVGLIPGVLIKVMEIYFDDIKLIPWREFFWPAGILIIINGLKIIRAVYIEMTAQNDDLIAIISEGVTRLIVIAMTLFVSPLIVDQFPSLGLNAVILTMATFMMLLEWNNCSRVNRTKKNAY